MSCYFGLTVNVLSSVASKVKRTLKNRGGSGGKVSDVGVLRRALRQLGKKGGVGRSAQGGTATAILSARVMIVDRDSSGLERQGDMEDLTRSFRAVASSGGLISGSMGPFGCASFGVGTRMGGVKSRRTRGFLSLTNQSVLRGCGFVRGMRARRARIPRSLEVKMVEVNADACEKGGRSTFLSASGRFGCLSLVLVKPGQTKGSALVKGLTCSSIGIKRYAVVFSCVNGYRLDRRMTTFFPGSGILGIRYASFRGLRKLKCGRIRIDTSPFVRCSGTGGRAARLVALMGSVGTTSARLSPGVRHCLADTTLIIFVANKDVQSIFRILRGRSIERRFLIGIPGDRGRGLRRTIADLRRLSSCSDGKGVRNAGLDLVMKVVSQLGGLGSGACVRLVLGGSATGGFGLMRRVRGDRLVYFGVPRRVFAASGRGSICYAC